MAYPVQTHYELVTALLEPLRAIFQGDADGQAGSQGAFDEFLASNELELALHIACDFLLTHKTKGIDSGILTRIEAAHSAMGIEDDCLSQLRLRYREQPNAIFSEVGKDAACRNPMGYTEEDVPRLIKDWRAKKDAESASPSPGGQ